MALTPEQRRLRAQLAAYARWSKHPARGFTAGQEGLLRKFEREVDPDNELPETERRRRAEARRNQHMKTLAFRSSRARAARQSGGDAA